MEVLKGKQWRNTQGISWSFGARQIRQLAKAPNVEMRLLQAASALPPAKLPNVKPSSLLLRAGVGTARCSQSCGNEESWFPPTSLPTHQSGRCENLMVSVTRDTMGKTITAIPVMHGCCFNVFTMYYSLFCSFNPTCGIQYAIHTHHVT